MTVFAQFTSSMILLLWFYKIPVYIFLVWSLLVWSTIFPSISKVWNFQLDSLRRFRMVEEKHEGERRSPHHEGEYLALCIFSTVNCKIFRAPGDFAPWAPTRALPWTCWTTYNTLQIPSWLEHRHDISYTQHVKQTLQKKNNNKQTHEAR